MAKTATGWIAALDRRLYPGVGDNWDDRLLRNAILGRLAPGARALDLGAGCGIVPLMDFRGHGAIVAGIDLDERVLANPFLDEARIAPAERIPYADGAFDLVFCDNVLEHLDHPGIVFAEVARVLKPGGFFLFKTPNSMHYMPLLARSTPLWFHRAFNRLRGRRAVDTFPTRYRANSPRAIAALARGAGMVVESLELIEGRPEYLRIIGPTYLCGALYERLVNRFDALACFRIMLLGCLRKSDDLQATPHRAG